MPAVTTTSSGSETSPLNGVIIGLLSSFGSAVLIALVFLVIYFFRYTSSGRVFLDRIGRPGEYDDEQAFLREEEEALVAMDDMQRLEYLRAKGKISFPPEPPAVCFYPPLDCLSGVIRHHGS